MATIIFTVASGARAASPDVDTQIVDALNKRYGAHPGYRANHAKGIVAQGSFTPSPHGAKLSRSPLFNGATSQVTVRFSDSGGAPRVPDASPTANPHGMAIKFHLPDGQESDIVVNALKFFPVATPEDFRDLHLAAATSPPGLPMSPQLRAFLDSHPSVERATATLGVPASFATEQYYGINAFVFVDKQGRKQPFRYIIAPDAIVHLGQDEIERQPDDYLLQELPQRLAKGPVTFHIRAQIAEWGDQTRDATRPWPDNRRIVNLGTLSLWNMVANSPEAEKKLLFLPGRLTDGIEPSDDPLIKSRDGAYAVSFRRRSRSP